MTICGHEAQAIRQRLDHYFAGRAEAPRSRYVLYSTGLSSPLLYLAAPRYLWRALRTSLRRGPPALLGLPVKGAEIRVKNNMRLVFTEAAGRCSVKIGLPSGERSGCLSREIRARRLLSRAPAGAVRVPAVDAYDERRLLWFREPQLSARDKAPPEEKAARFLADYAQALYRPRVRSRPVARQLRFWRIELPELQACFDEAGASLPPEAAAGTWPVALIHGDLSPGNMIAERDGGLAVIDWELFGRGPVAFDLRTLHYLCPRQVIDLLARLSAPGDLAPALQMRLAFGVDLAIARRNRARILDYHRLRLGRPARVARDEFARREQALLARIAAPLPPTRKSE